LNLLIHFVLSDPFLPSLKPPSAPKRRSVIMKKFFVSITLLAILLVLWPGSAFAQAYTFNISEETVNVLLNEDGSATLDYTIVFNNDPNAHPIDFVDLGMPNTSFIDSSITADVNGVGVNDISRGGFQGTGPGVVAGVAIGLGGQTISPGKKGTVHVHVGQVQNLLQPDTQKGQASAVFAPAWFSTAHGETNLTVVFQFPKSVSEKDATYHSSQPGWADQPIGMVNESGLVIFTWNNPGVTMNHEIDFGASFPSTLFPNGVSAPGTTSTASTNQGLAYGGLFLLLLIGGGAYFMSTNRNKTAYESPKVSIEGYSIKRGLTAVQAAVLLKEPIDKILTMILFSVVKKGAAQVTSTAPLEINIIDPHRTDLESYETSFLEAFSRGSGSNEAIHDGLASAMVKLFQDVDRSMEGFDRQQTVDYYRNIVRDAWTQVEAADTPEVTSQKFEQNLSWALLDKEYAPRTQRLFEAKQVFLPTWWLHLDPTIHHSSAGLLPTPQVSVPGSSAAAGTPTGNINPPVLPGADFAASVVRGTQNFSSQVIGDINTFTQDVNQKAFAPPPPQPPSQSFFGSSSTHRPTYHPRPSGGGGHHCACACAGGGR
jgi:hypothetical protein